MLQRISRSPQQWWDCTDTGLYPPQTHLFLDDLYIRDHRGLKREVTSPTHVSRDAPIFRAEKDWEGIAITHRCRPIIYDDEENIFKFWYPCHDRRIENLSRVPRRWAYAVSRDGLHWERPRLGLVPFSGSTDNNIVSLENIDADIAILQNVSKDTRDPDPQRRYKAIGLGRHTLRPGEITWAGAGGFDSDWYKTFGSKIGCGIFISYSPDGLRWTMKEGWAGSAALIADGSVLHGFDERINKWVMWQRPRIMPKFRTFGISTSDDFEHWTFPEDPLAPDEHDPPGMQVDSLVTIAAPDSGYIGLAGMSGYAGEGFKASELLPQLVFSRDGRQWVRVDRSPYLTPASADAWNGSPCILPCAPICVDDEIFVFYYGKNHGKMWGEPTLDGKGIVTSALGLAKLPRDRWVALAGDTAGGELTTPLVTFHNTQLHINADAAQGSIAVELLDYAGQSVEGYRLHDCDPIRGDALDHPVTWNGSGDLTQLIGTARMQPAVGRAMRIRFVLERAKLFSFTC